MRSEIVAQLAHELGFQRAGIAPAVPVGRADYVADWLRRGRHGEMAYLERWADLRTDPRRLLPGARSIIVVAHNYRQVQELERKSGEEWERGRGEDENDGRPVPAESEIGNQSAIRNPRFGRIAQYAWGRDYHKVIRRKLHRLVDELRRELDEPFEARVCVDTAPLIEREVAALAGIGWIGKNTMVLHEDLGSFFFLGEVLTTLALAPSEPAVDHCGTCTRCLEACPTGALTEPYQMDAARCISYLTIEHRSAIPERLQTLMGDWVYGCDICQDVCPHNSRTPPAVEPSYRPTGRNPLVPQAPLGQLMDWDDRKYQENLAGSPMKRASLQMLKRNARVAAANGKNDRPPQ